VRASRLSITFGHAYAHLRDVASGFLAEKVPGVNWRNRTSSPAAFAHEALAAVLTGLSSLGV
jgi:hypothetical protein